MKRKKKKSSQLARQKKNRRKKNQAKKQIPKVLKKEDLEVWKQRLYPMIEEANHRIEAIQHSGYYSYAVDKVLTESNRDYFSIDDIETREDLVREITRVRVFLNDKGSTIDGAILQTAEIQGKEYIGKFGNNYHNLENHFKNYDIKTIKGDVAARAFANYRRIEEHRATEIVNEGGYGSENLIVALYDAEIRGLDSLEYGERLLDAFQEESDLNWSDATSQLDDVLSMSYLFTDNIGGVNF